MMILDRRMMMIVSHQFPAVWHNCSDYIQYVYVVQRSMRHVEQTEVRIEMRDRTTVAPGPTRPSERTTSGHSPTLYHVMYIIRPQKIKFKFNFFCPRNGLLKLLLRFSAPIPERTSEARLIYVLPLAAGLAAGAPQTRGPLARRRLRRHQLQH